MAKQHVSFIERHLEKIIFGVMGTVLVVVAVWYLIIGPNRVEVAGMMEPKGPGDLYETMRVEADRLLERMRAAEPTAQDDDPDHFRLPDPQREISPLVTDPSLTPEFAVAFMLPSKRVPQVRDDSPLGDLMLASALAPSRPALSTGRAYAGIPESETIDVRGQRAGAGVRRLDTRGGRDALPADHHWVTVTTAFSRAAQLAEYAKAGYVLRRQKVVFADVEVQRQELLPEGKWGEPELVGGYRPVVHANLRRNVPVQRDGVTWSLRDEDLQYISSLSGDLEKNQEEIARPPFQTFLGDYVWNWTVESPQGHTFDWEAFEVSMYDPDDSPRRTTPERGGRLQAVEDLRAARAMIERRNFIEAEELLERVVGNRDASDGQMREAENLLRQHQSDITSARQALALERDRLEEAREQLLGEEIEPIWVNDLSVVPGRTYRYRARVVLFNPYAGVAVEMRDPQDAGKVLIPGAWSPWSAEIEVPPTRYLFFASANLAEPSADLRGFDWSGGEWETLRQTSFRIGEPVSFSRANRIYDFDVIVADIAGDQPYTDRQERAGVVDYQPGRTTEKLTLMDPEGQVEVRFQALDEQRRREVDAERRDELQRLTEFRRRGTGATGRLDVGGDRRPVPGPAPRGPAGRPPAGRGGS